MPEEAALTPYDQVPYPAGAYAQSHPERLATLARLFGMSPPAVGRCRVLELGCADGSNLIPMACALPESRFLGVDLSARQIRSGQRTAASVGLSNLELRHLNCYRFNWRHKICRTGVIAGWGGLPDWHLILRPDCRSAVIAL
jgi:tRNA G46 methylase TrmB